MQSITKTYLVDIIGRSVCQTIHIHRQSRGELRYYDVQSNESVTDEEIVEFIFMIPYFDERLKDFLLGNIPEQTIIISQSWEIEFLKKCMLWVESREWLYGGGYSFEGSNNYSKKDQKGFLSLPY